MDKIKLSLFDIFVYILPGGIIMLSLDLIINQRKDFTEDLFRIAKSFTLFEVAIILVACYLLGFVNQFISYENFKIVSKLWKKRMADSETSYSKLEDKIVQIRQYSPENFSTLYMWFTFRGMCYSLYQASTLFLIVLIVRAFQTDKVSDKQILEIIVTVICAFIFLRRAITFHEWTHRVIKHTMDNIESFKKK